jgi:cobalt-zinc-cadmium efflux system protein
MGVITGSENQNEHVHGNDKSGAGSKLLFITLLNLAISVVQIFGGLISNSLSLLSDSFHNLGDTTTLFIAYLAGKKSRIAPDHHKTFGYRRIEILAALFNGIVLVAICVFLFYEAVRRFLAPEPVLSKIMLPVALFGFLVNFGSMLVLYRGQKENINIKAAYLHLLADSLTSVAVIAGSVLMLLYGTWWIDPLISIVVSMFIIYKTWDIIKETVDILMQASPSEVNINQVKKSLEDIGEINNIHHVHIWKLDDSLIHFEAHISLKRNMNMMEMMECKKRVEDKLKTGFGIAHTTLQLEFECCPEGNLIVKDN